MMKRTTLILEDGVFEGVKAVSHRRRLREILESLHHPCGNLFFDLRTAGLMRENGVLTIYKADADFLQIPGIDLVNPLKRV